MLFNPRQDQTSRDILGAADIIKQNGWVQRVLWNQHGHHNRGVCAKGALIVAITGHRDNWVHELDHKVRLRNALRHLENHIGFYPNQHLDTTFIPSWNDDPVRTKEEVIRVMCESVGVSSDVLVPA